MNRTVSPTAESTSWLQYVSHQLGEQELRRRMWHFFPGVLALSFAGVPHLPTIRLWVMLLVVAFGILLPAWCAVRYQRLYCRHRKENLAPSILGYVIPLTVLCLTFRSHIEIPLAVAAIIAFGDGSATFAGLLAGGSKIPWNRQKSWSGLMGFLVCGSILATCVYWIAAPASVGLFTTALCVTPVVAICGLLESLPLKINDNLTIGCSAAVLLPLMQLLVIG